MSKHPRLVELKPSAWTYFMLFFFAPLCLFLTCALTLFTIGPLGVGSIGPIQIVSPETHTPKTALVLLPFWTMLVLMWRGCWLGLFVRISRVGYIVKDGLLFLQPFFGKKRVLSLAELSGYSHCSLPLLLRSSWGGEGLALYVVGRGPMQLNEMSFNDISLLRAMLQHTGVRYLGEEICWFYPFQKSRFKFQPK